MGMLIIRNFAGLFKQEVEFLISLLWLYSYNFFRHLLFRDVMPCMLAAGLLTFQDSVLVPAANLSCITSEKNEGLKKPKTSHPFFSLEIKF